MKKLIIKGSIFLAVAFALFWFYYPLRSYLVMSIYSNQQSGESVMQENGFSINMQSGEGWYPFVMTYNASRFSSWSGIDADMSIMYNFGAFDPWTRTSSIYDQESDKYSSFYGVYALRKSVGEFGFSEGGIDLTEVTTAVKYDYTQLVIEAFGCGDPVFYVDSCNTADNIEYAGNGGWTRIDAVITANGAAHNYGGYKTPYLQYGRPMSAVDQDFSEITLYGRIYAKYFKEYDCTLMVYVIAPSEDAVESCDNNILQKTTVTKSE